MLYNVLQSTLKTYVMFFERHALVRGMVTDKDLKWIKDRLYEEIESGIWCQAFNEALKTGKSEREAHQVAEVAIKNALKNREKLINEVHEQAVQDQHSERTVESICVRNV